MDFKPIPVLGDIISHEVLNSARGIIARSQIVIGVVDYRSPLYPYRLRTNYAKCPVGLSIAKIYRSYLNIETINKNLQDKLYPECDRIYNLSDIYSTKRLLCSILYHADDYLLDYLCKIRVFSLLNFYGCGKKSPINHYIGRKYWGRIIILFIKMMPEEISNNFSITLLHHILCAGNYSYVNNNFTVDFHTFAGEYYVMVQSHVDKMIAKREYLEQVEINEELCTKLLAKYFVDYENIINYFLEIGEVISLKNLHQMVHSVEKYPRFNQIWRNKLLKIYNAECNCTALDTYCGRCLFTNCLK